MGIGHENYFLYALNKYFQDHQINNCEAVSFNINADDEIIMKRRGEEKQIEKI